MLLRGWLIAYTVVLALNILVLVTRFSRLQSYESSLRLSHGYVIPVVALDGIHYILALNLVLHVKEPGYLREKEPHMRSLRASRSYSRRRRISPTAMAVLEA